MSFKVGCDPEFFVMEATTGSVVPVCGRVGGTKEKPLSIPSNKLINTTVQEDGVALELGMSAVGVYHFSSYSSMMMKEAAAWVAKRSLIPSWTQAAFEFAEADLKPFNQAFVLGCAPDRSAYTRGVSRNPIDINDLGMRRFTGGHLHFSYPCKGKGEAHAAENGTPTWAIVQMIDAFALLFWPHYTADKQAGRYEFYGKPGLYRTKPYGLEYRTPTNHSVSGGQDSVDTFAYDCGAVVQGCATMQPEEVRAWYDKIDWVQLEKMLDLKALPTHNDRMNFDGGAPYHYMSELRRSFQRVIGELRNE